MTNWDLVPVDEGRHKRRPPPLNDIVPADIWATIFQVAYENQHKICQEIPQGPQTSHFFPRKALLLGQVCRHWRAIATSQPLLWRNIYVCMQHKAPYSLLETYLERTGDADLYISIVAYSSDIDDVHELRLQSCFQLLHSVSHRWKSVSFTLGETARAEFEKLFCGDGDVKRPDFSSLETVAAGLGDGREYMRRSNYEFIGHFCDTAKITPACLRIGGWFVGTFSFPAPKYVQTNARLQSLTSIRLFRQGFGDWIPIFSSLAMMSQLKHLELNDCFCRVLADRHSERVTLPRLEKLAVLDMDHHGDVEAIYKTILLPALTDVTFTPSLHAPSFYEMVNLSNCKIRRLSMKANNRFYEYLFYFLAAPAFSKLEELTLNATELDNQQIQFFDTAPATFDVPKIRKQVTTPVFGGTLRSLTLLGCDSEDGLLGKVASARMKNGSLRHFYVEVLDGVEKGHKTDDKIFSSLRRTGFDAHLRQRNVSTIQADEGVESSESSESDDSADSHGIEH